MGASALWHSELSLRQLGSRPTVFIPRWATHLCILYQACGIGGATHDVTDVRRQPKPLGPEPTNSDKLQLGYD